jgi:hypothetical protein
LALWYLMISVRTFRQQIHLQPLLLWSDLTGTLWMLWL